jgi:23S rRNA (cytidine1920-2'-O)/16S rRNA (cytidine1409-2'-O)-methyltransferase
VIRLDAELVRRGLARSREHASELIAAGRVEARGVIASKPATGVGNDTPLRVLADVDDPNYASRGGVKLAGALQTFDGLAVAGRACLDAGASTGGFTDVLLRAGAASVVADERVQVIDRTNIRTLTPDLIGGPVELTVADLSFISLKLVLAALSTCTDPDGDIVPMVKPQFEVGRERLGSGGVVRNPEHRVDAVLGVAESAGELGWGVAQVAASPLPGPAGNVEFFLWLRRDAPRVDRAAIEEIVLEAR